jgi:hypothetical protein
MSRYHVKTNGYTIVLGWDNPLETYFAQVWKGEPESAENRHPDFPSLGPHPLLWLGTERHQVPTVEELMVKLRPYVELPPSVREQLKADVTRRDEQRVISFIKLNVPGKK